MHQVEYRRVDGKLIWKGTYREGNRVPVCPYTSTIIGEYDVYIDGERVEERILRRES